MSCRRKGREYSVFEILAFLPPAGSNKCRITQELVIVIGGQVGSSAYTVTGHFFWIIDQPDSIAHTVCKQGTGFHSKMNQLPVDSGFHAFYCHDHWGLPDYDS